MCPAFVADCLETLEEIAIRGSETFHSEGGGTLTLIPCLNDHPAWIEGLTSIVSRHMNAGLAYAG
jgi:ferrochelatase